LIDVDYITKAQSGDKQAFKVIFTSYRQKVYRTAFLILRDYQQAEDVVQETFMQVYLKLNKLSNPMAFKKWLYRITMNSCMEVMRKRKKNSLETPEDDLDAGTEKMAVDFNLPESKLIQKEQQMKIMECISKLSIKHRTVLILYYYNDFDVKEIAEIIGSTEGTVKSRLFYGRKLLREVLKAEGFDTEDDTEGGVMYGK
jgi:RNA polymerase sigma-70 factor (ECF subfamily)